MNEIATTTETQTPMTLIQSAIDKGMPVENLGKLMDLQERWEANQAAKAFAEALTGFQREMPPIKKDRTVNLGGNRGFTYAGFDDVMSTAKPILAKYGIVVSFDTESPTAGIVKATCRIRVGTHSESSSVTVPVPTGNVNAAQLYGQAVTYAKRYAMCAALNIVVTDEDVDAAVDEFLSKEQIEHLSELLAGIATIGDPVDEAKFFKWVGLKVDAEGLTGDFRDLERIPQSRYQDCVKMLLERKNKSAKKAGAQ